MAPTSASGITFRGDVHYVVTEYGFALLVGKRIKERVQELLNISHSKFKDELTKYVKDTYNN
ncbi:MAG: hypothetical protein O6940_09645 [Ignavibacteria bacterium]|nr:hypothetical protein [Ignavibacteria bacterium]